ncbi:MAG: hypothetical protein AB7D92_00795, partial [Sphaerochaeta sp.]
IDNTRQYYYILLKRLFGHEKSPRRGLNQHFLEIILYSEVKRPEVYSSLNFLTKTKEYSYYYDLQFTLGATYTWH